MQTKGAEMTIASRVVSSAIRGVSRTICRVDSDELARVPMHGPLILVTNHVNFLDAPVLFTHLMPRPVTGLVKVETWDNPFLNVLFTLWKAIPIRRGEADMKAFRQAKQALADKQILVVAPEGTRSRTGLLQYGKPGFTLLANMTDSPIMPMAFYGGELFWDNIHHLTRTDFHIRVGNMFKINKDLDIRKKETRQKITDETMFRIAELLPKEYRGVYSNPPENYPEYLHSLD
jgi:1-acyl-sn-glycerol-3-phosphate acyltransferase